MHISRREVHDRDDIWFIKEDGSNLDEVIHDLLQVIKRVGLPALDTYSDPAAVIHLVNSGGIMARPGSPAANEVVRAARAQLSSN